jgi:hypothetical protein
MSIFRVLGPLGLVAVLPWQAQTALIALVLIVALAGISFLWRSQGEVWSFLYRMRTIEWGSFKIVMKDSEDIDKNKGYSSARFEIKKS